MDIWTTAHQPVALPPLAHHDGSATFVSHPFPELGQQVVLRVLTRRQLQASGVHLRVVVDGEPDHRPARLVAEVAEGQWWEVPLEVVNHRVHYRFLVQAADGGHVLNARGLFRRDMPDAQDFVLTTDPPVPAWALDGVAYQVFCDRFAPGGVDLPLPEWAVEAQWDTPVAANTPDGVRQLYGGTLWGIVDRLDHLVDLGVTILYLTPFFPARSNHRYDSTTFDRVDELLGGDEALRALTTACRERGIRVIGDLTLNHTGVGHEWFATAQADPTSPEAGFYLFEDQPDGPGYACFWDVASLPKLDHRSAELRRRLYDGPDSVVARYVRDFGLSGWRIDVAQSAGIHRGTDANLEVARLTRRTLDALAAAGEGPDNYLVAEMNHDATASLAGDGWQGTMAYASFTKPVWSWLGGASVGEQWSAPVHFAPTGADVMAAQMDDFNALVPWRSRVAGLLLLDSHDTARFRTIGGRDAQELATVLMHTMPGIPMLFAGDEYGVEGSGLEDSRRPFPWQGPRDEQMFEHHRRLLRLRREHEALRRGGFRWLHACEQAVVLERWGREERVVVQVAAQEHPPVTLDTALVSLLDGTRVEAGEALPAGPGFGIWLRAGA